MGRTVLLALLLPSLCQGFGVLEFSPSLLRVAARPGSAEEAHICCSVRGGRQGGRSARMNRVLAASCTADKGDYEIAYPAGVEGPGEVDAFLFDCDGTLVDSMPMWTANWRETTEMFGLRWEDDSFLYRHAGKSIQETLKVLCEAQGKTFDAEQVEAFFAAKEANMALLFPHVTEITPVANIARGSAGVLRMAVVSSGPRQMVEALLEQAGIDHLFEFCICAEDVLHHKPSPEPYLKAAGMMGISPSRCRVFEDAEAGIAAGLAAGMQTVDVRVMCGYPRQGDVRVMCGYPRQGDAVRKGGGEAPATAEAKMSIVLAVE